MRPLGRFFQVTETLDFRKYFLDIDKIQRFPITFVIKTDLEATQLRIQIRHQAAKIYGVDRVVERYMASIEELINIPTLQVYLAAIAQRGELKNVLQEIIIQSRIEFNAPTD